MPWDRLLYTRIPFAEMLCHSLHGVRFVTEKCRSLWCRIFWILALIACGFGLHQIFKGTYKSYREDALSFNPDMNMLEFQSNFPAISVCEEFIFTTSKEKINQFYPGFLDKYHFDYRQMFTEQCFGDRPCSLCNTGCKPPINCSLDFREMARVVRKSCDELIHSCTWLNNCDCCEYFLPIDTKFGTCYSLNTLQSHLTGSVPLLRLNISTGPGVVSFSIYKTIKVYVHGIEDIPSVISEEDLMFKADDETTFYFRLVEMTNSPLVQNVDMQLRKCRFRNEVNRSSPFDSYQIYSYSTCITSCVRKLMFEKCNCVHHLIDVPYYDDFICNYTGLGCLAEYEMDKSLGPTQTCIHCLPSCEESFLSKVILLKGSDDDENDDDNDDDYRVKIMMTELPSMRYKRNVLRTRLDLVVSIGGLIGLFFGASLLSLVEAVYFLCIRKGAYRS